MAIEALSDIVRSSTSAFASGGAGSGASGIATVNFGINGSDKASVDVVGQAGITSQTPVFVQVAARYTLKADSSLDHSPDEAMTERVRFYASTPSSDTGFTIYGIAEFHQCYGKFDVYWSWR